MNTPAQTPAYSPISARLPPSARQGPLAWLRRRFFDGWMQSLLSLCVLGVLAMALPPLWQWGVTHAVLQADNAACRAALRAPRELRETMLHPTKRGAAP